MKKNAVEMLREEECLLNKLRAFFTNNKNVYIYGAGEFAGYIYTVCRSFNYIVDGFITSTKERDEYKGLPVYSLEEINNNNIKDISIIPGFYKCTKQFINKQLIKVNYLDINPQIYNRLYTRCVIEKLKNKSKSLPSDKNTKKEVLIIRLDAIGDVICTTPLIRAVAENNKDCKISVMLQTSISVLLNGNKSINRIIGYSGNRYKEIEDLDAVIKEAEDIINKNGLYGIEQVYLAMHILEGRNALLSLAVAVLCNPKVIYAWARKDGGESERNGLIAKSIVSKVVFIDRPMHEIDFMLEMLGKQCAVKQREIEVSEIKRNTYVDDILKKQDTEIFIAVAMVGSVEKKNWHVRNYEQLFKIFEKTERNIKFVLFGAKDALEKSEKISKYNNVINLVDRLKLEESVYAINKCDLFLGSNTGLMHIAAALGKPCITLYASLQNATKWDSLGPVRWGVRNVKHIDLIPKRGLDGCIGGCCRNKSHCINQISVNHVVKAINKIKK